ncbi:methylamine dehydrogenase accessory protein MauD [Pelagibacterium sp. 26DY04]|uniref:methylamine dehydrogenase accessory protein MauD n=1 Tax=unclassified Pelagibacterium TaxID=2623280 RepID=UPI002815D7F8|nr:MULTISPECIES: methylamine dehydrogenase accessory protein MauD [unclassified Pelagibacterium]WMT86642.1 methylamine dehydrogenase accessory protein MauD [Pelagibacterium sp. 26DY04]WMT89211.1 methylamine dehydrogenase accessory protein MauD [Pelagibacterium sp. H642]
MNALIFAVGVLWVVVLALIVVIFALARQIGVLFERVSPMGALVNDAGPKIGDRTPVYTLPNLNGGVVSIGPKPSRSTLVFFLSPTCPVCKKLLPILRSVKSDESKWLDVVLASDGEVEKHKRFIETANLSGFPYVVSTELGLAYRVSRLPFAVLYDEHGTIKAKGLINNREQLESLFNAAEMGVGSIQNYLDAPIPAN